MVLTSLSNASRESRHVLVHGLPDTLPQEEINRFFSKSGRVQKIEKNLADGSYLISFMDVRSAQKAHNCEDKINGCIPFRIAFYEPDVKTGGVPAPTSSSNNDKIQFSISNSSSNLLQRIPLKRPGMNARPLKEMKTEKSSTPQTPSTSTATPNLSAAAQTPTISHQPTTSSNNSSGGTHLTAVIVERLPLRSDNTLKEAVREQLCKVFGKNSCGAINIENESETTRRAVCWFQRFDEKLSAEHQNLTILSQRVRLRVAPTCSGQTPSTAGASSTGAIAGPSTDNNHARCSTPSSSTSSTSNFRQQKHGNGEIVDPFHPKASRVLYVGNLDKRCPDEVLRQRFGKYGDILDVEVKNAESPMPFAFRNPNLEPKYH